MKKGFLLFFLLINRVAFGQNDTVKLFYDYAWKQTTAEAGAQYYKLIYKKDKRWITDIFRTEDKKQTRSISYAVLDSVREGNFTSYYNNGKIEQQGAYSANIKTGAWRYWAPDGKLEAEVSYLSDLDTIIRVIREDSIIKRLVVETAIRYQRTYYEGVRDGISKWYHPNGKQSSEELYKNGKIVHARYWDKKNVEKTFPLVDFYDDEQRPFFYRDGDFNEFIRKAIVYPEKAQKRQLDGKVGVSFDIDKDGKLKQLYVNYVTDDVFRAEALRVLKLTSGAWYLRLNHNRWWDRRYDSGRSQIFVEIPFKLPVQE